MCSTKPKIIANAVTVATTKAIAIARAVIANALPPSAPTRSASGASH